MNDVTNTNKILEELSNHYHALKPGGQAHQIKKAIDCIQRLRGIIEGQCCYLIEGDDNYFTGRFTDARGFEKDPNKALRFARREDADCVKYHLLETYSFALRTTEHLWLPSQQEALEKELVG